jgi:hypothetical protein
MAPAKDIPVTTGAISYRFDGPGPASFIVRCGNELRVYCRGVLSGPISDTQVSAMLAGPHCRWVAASGELMLPSDDSGWPSITPSVPHDADVPAPESA